MNVISVIHKPVRITFTVCILVICGTDTLYSSRISENEAFSNRLYNLVHPLLLQNEDVRREVADLGAAILDSNDLDDGAKKYRFHVLVEPLANSFSTPSGDVYVTTGLLRILSSRDELASVIAREIALVEMDAFRKGTAGERTKERFTIAASLGIYSIGLSYTIGSIIENLDQDKVFTTTSSILPALTLVLSSVPELLLARSRSGRLKDADIAGELMRGREPYATGFDARILKVIYEGYGAGIELEADSMSVELLKHTNYDPLALEAVLEKLHTHGGIKRSHLKSAAPGLAVRLEKLAARQPRKALPKTKKSEIWEDFD